MPAALNRHCQHINHQDGIIKRIKKKVLWLILSLQRNGDVHLSNTGKALAPNMNLLGLTKQQPKRNLQLSADLRDLDLGDVNPGDFDLGDLDLGNLDLKDLDLGDLDLGDMDPGDLDLIDLDTGDLEPM